MKGPLQFFGILSIVVGAIVVLFALVGLSEKETGMDTSGNISAITIGISSIASGILFCAAAEVCDRLRSIDESLRRPSSTVLADSSFVQKYRIDGRDEATGYETTIMVEANSRDDAIAKAMDRGVAAINTTPA